MEDEIWKDVVGYEGYYKVSNYGRVMSTWFKTPKIMKQYTCPLGYKKVDLNKPGEKRKIARVHRLVAKAFLLNPDNKPEVNHIDYNPSNNYLSNLEWVTTLENNKHSYCHKPTEYTWTKETSTNIKYIYLAKGKYYVHIPQYKQQKSFNTLEEAIVFRDIILKTKTIKPDNEIHHHNNPEKYITFEKKCKKYRLRIERLNYNKMFKTLQEASEEKKRILKAELDGEKIE